MEIGVDDGAIYVSWDPVSHASGYLVQLFDADDESKALEEASLEDDEDYYAFDADLDKDIVYKVKLQALGTGAYYDSNRRVKTVTVESGSSGKQLSTPKNLEAYLDEGELTIEWDAVDGAV
ncbi:MAG: hypothetical protein MR374_00100, partial [Clostridia bacterium]|nr:hypothetical protein [Clostridia bacterium]